MTGTDGRINSSRTLTWGAFDQLTKITGRDIYGTGNATSGGVTLGKKP